MDFRTGTISSLLAMREQGNDTFTPFSGEPEVHIWTQTLPIREDQLQTAAAMESDAMTSEEHERMVRISRTSRLQAHCWMISRVFLRRVLAQYMQLQARDIRFEYGTSGKPYLVGGPQFSLSHTNGLCVLAVTSTNNELGVDVEWVRPIIARESHHPTFPDGRGAGSCAGSHMFRGGFFFPAVESPHRQGGLDQGFRSIFMWTVEKSEYGTGYT